MPETNLEKRYVPRLLTLYRQEIRPGLIAAYGNLYAVPRLLKISINMGVGEATQDAKISEKAAEELSTITGQRAKVCRSRKPISNFKLKKGVPVGCHVTLRHGMMYEFLDRLITVAVPRIRDFRGFAPGGFDGNGNYTFGLIEQTIFPEIVLDKVSRTQGMNITIVTRARTDDEGRQLLKLFGFPFRR